MDKINNINEWLSAMNAGDVRYGLLMRGRVGSMRSVVSFFNKTRGYDRHIYVHAHYDWDQEVAVFICVTCEERIKESDKSYANEWKKQIPKNYD